METDHYEFLNFILAVEVVYPSQLRLGSKLMVGALEDQNVM